MLSTPPYELEKFATALLPAYRRRRRLQSLEELLQHPASVRAAWQTLSTSMLPATERELPSVPVSLATTGASGPQRVLDDRPRPRSELAAAAPEARPQLQDAIETLRPAPTSRACPTARAPRYAATSLRTATHVISSRCPALREDPVAFALRGCFRSPTRAALYRCAGSPLLARRCTSRVASSRCDRPFAAHRRACRRLVQTGAPERRAARRRRRHRRAGLRAYGGAAAAEDRPRRHRCRAGRRRRHRRDPVGPAGRADVDEPVRRRRRSAAREAAVAIVAIVLGLPLAPKLPCSEDLDVAGGAAPARATVALALTALSGGSSCGRSMRCPSIWFSNSAGRPRRRGPRLRVLRSSSVPTCPTRG